MYVYLIMVMQEPCLCLGCIWSVALTSAFLISWKAVVAGEVHFIAVGCCSELTGIRFSWYNVLDGGKYLMTS